MKSKITLSFTVIVLIISFFAFRSDDDPFTELLKKLDDYTTKYPQEKVYLQLDKPYYAVGDDIWFKAYVINSKTLAPTDLSKIIYVDLINEKDSLQRHIKLPLAAGITWGDFKLPDSLNEGNYRIRAYTNYMRNFGAEFFFDKTIKIGNGWSNKVFTSTVYKISADKIEADIHFEDKNEIAYSDNDVSYEVQVDGKTVSRGKTKTGAKGNALLSFANNPNVSKTGKILATITIAGKEKVLKSIPVTSTSNMVDVQFMPEGGTLIEDLPSRIAVKVLNSSGLGEEVTGKIIDNEGIELTAFTTALGMGSFFNKAEAGKTYTAKIKFKDGSEKDFKLPSAQKSGYVLSINNADTGKVNIKLLLSKDLAQGEELKLVVQQGGTIYNVSKATADRQVLISSISKSKLPSGIVQFTLFSGTNQPVAERLVFIKNQADLIEIKGSVKSAGRKEKSIISIDALNN
ncbi:MAG: TonB-dependent receptor, partial [Chitinophagaceae bacterium]